MAVSSFSIQARGLERAFKRYRSPAPTPPNSPVLLEAAAHQIDKAVWERAEVAAAAAFRDVELSLKGLDVERSTQRVLEGQRYEILEKEAEDYLAEELEEDSE